MFASTKNLEIMPQEAPFAPVGLTESFTNEQREALNPFLDDLVDHCLGAIEGKQSEIKAMDKRPHQTYSEAEPNVFMPYVAQGMLEDLIAFLQSHV